MDERRDERLVSETLVHSLKRGQRRAHPCRNISRLGCKIADAGLAASTGEDIEIELVEGSPILARVIWARQGHVGLAFRHEIDFATLRRVADPDAPSDYGLRDRLLRRAA